MEFSNETLLFFIAILAGWVDTIAGGLITIPVLMKRVSVPIGKQQAIEIYKQHLCKV